jgi:hypothetical protein
MTTDGKSNPTSKRVVTRPKASNYDMFVGLQQTRLKAADANRKRLLASNAPVTPPVSEE